MHGQFDGISLPRRQAGRLRVAKKRRSACLVIVQEIQYSMRGNKCSDVMTSNLTCCVPDDTVHVVAQSMKAQNVGAMPVIDSHDKKRLIGIVTDRDLALKVVAQDREARKTKVEEVMTRNLVVCKTDDSWQMALDAMAKHQLRRIPVVDHEGRLAGIIAQADVATRIEQPAATAKVVEEISRAA